ncbi:MAG: type II toxin-antitoxin system VapB family antitoxin [Oscillospiraceae bacterium]|jgi:Arc/MetJ family transcription regulator|nr:type II toxin-antitoxin system VapB family antitoxin [Oscillospiraceae bacterium]
MTKTTVDIDTTLLEEAVKLFAGKTKREIISAALLEYVAQHKRKDLYDLFDSDVQWLADDYDYKAMRGDGDYGVG